MLAHEVAEPTTESEAGNASVRDLAARRGELMLLCCLIELTPKHPRTSTNVALDRINRDSLHAGEIDDESILADCVASDAVASATHADRQLFRARKPEGGNDIRTRGATRDQGRRLDSIIPFQI